MASDNPSRQQFGDRPQGGSSQQGSGPAPRGTQAGYTGTEAAGDPPQSAQARSAYGSAEQGDRGEWGRQGTPEWRSRMPAWRSGMPAQGGGYDAAQYGRNPGGYGYGTGPFALMRRISDEMDRLFENFGMGGRNNLPEAAGTEPAGAQRNALWSPHLEVRERNGKLLVQVDLPGVKREDVNLEIDQDALVIQGHRHQESEHRGQGYYHSERSYGSFYRRVPLPEGTDTEQAHATFRDGVLEVELPLPQQQQRARRLEIRDGGTTYAGSATSASGEATSGPRGGTGSGGGASSGGSTGGMGSSAGMGSSGAGTSGAGGASATSIGGQHGSGGTP